MLPARVLIIDDSVVVRKFVSDVIEKDPMLELAGTAATASIGLQKVAQCNPDVVVMDIEMPEMDGIEAARRAKAMRPSMPILMCSTLTERGASVTLRALAAGASDYVAKPVSLSGTNAIEGFRNDLASKLRALTGRMGPAPVLPVALRPVPAAAPAFGPVVKPEAIVIGSSTGGPNALHTLFADLPGDLPVPLFLVQHMPPIFTRMLAERLTATSKVRVYEAVHGATVEKGCAYIAPGDHHLTILRDGASLKTMLNKDPVENSCRPAVDVLFRSAAQVFKQRLLGVVLTGMGQDGARGARAIVDAGGTMWVQDRESCVVPSMPVSAQAAVNAEVVPLGELATRLARRARLLKEN